MKGELKMFDYIWNFYGLMCGIFLVTSIWHQVPLAFYFSVGAGGAWIVMESIKNIHNLNLKRIGDKG